ncbi:hypothetical protein H2204_001091 [Knufia peltigerae]|uniref:6-methylsalicylate decarboxylase n=1 Tax=Knufia peltigerae TaxID=1002370 RepID=A0AA38YDL4_9EURO|nr:hypothetical protein H2204_001091 [Knufia peltigerae]
MSYTARQTSNSARKVDVHHHLVPDVWKEEITKIALGPEEIPPLNWTLEGSESFMKKAGLTTTIFSLTTPGVTKFDLVTARRVARAVNEYSAELREKNPGKFGFFATLPSLHDDIYGAVEEARYALTTLKAEGVIVFTHYGPENHYLGHPSFRPLWKLLDDLKAIAFVHPCPPRDKATFPDTLLPHVTEYPHETTRSAVDLIFSNTRRDHPSIKFILSHAGGTLPYLAGRVSFMEIFPSSPNKKGHEEIYQEIQSFYYDLAMSGHPNTLRTLLGFVPEDHILFGSDYPYALEPGIRRMNDNWEEFPLYQQTRDMINFENAEKILPMFQKS